MGAPSRNMAKLYKELAERRDNCSFVDAVERHELINGMYCTRRMGLWIKGD